METQTKTVERAKIATILTSDTTTKLKDAHKSALVLGGALATFTETVFDKPTLENAKKEVYLLAVDSRGMPEKEGWYLVERGKEVNFKTINDKEAEALRKADRWDEVLYVNSDAINALKEKRPVALYVVYDYRNWRYLGANDWSNDGARVAWTKHKPEVSQLLRQMENATSSLLKGKIEEFEETLAEISKTAKQLRSKE